MAFVELKQVNKIYLMGDQEVHAIKDVSFEFEQGEFIVIVGPSGAGKTTVLNLLGGMDHISSGEILVNGSNISHYSEHELTCYRRDKIGFVFQFYNLIQNLTARENVELASEICKEPLDALEVLESVGLSHRVNNFPSQLSGGEQQRVSIARAIAKNPELLLADEPTGALDYKTGKEILKLLQDVCRTFNKTVVVITHNSAFMALADRVIKISNGSVQENYINEQPQDASTIEW